MVDCPCRYECASWYGIYEVEMGAGNTAVKLVVVVAPAAAQRDLVHIGACARSNHAESVSSY